MKVPSPDTIKLSAISHLRELGSDEEADLLSRCTLEIGDTGQRYAGSTHVGLNITLRCKTDDLPAFEDPDSIYGVQSATHLAIQRAIDKVLPAQLQIHDLSARSLLVDPNSYERKDLVRLIEAQVELMISVATGGPRIETKDHEYKERRQLIRARLQSLRKRDPNAFEDLWAWYGRWSSGDLPTYQSRRDYIRTMYRQLLADLAGVPVSGPSEPSREPTGWEKVDRTVDKIIASLEAAQDEEELQTVGLLCRECLISLAQAVFDPTRHIATDGTRPSETDAYRMLEGYFSCEFFGSENEALRRHAKAALSLANSLQHKRTARYIDAALCSEATRTLVNIVAITSEKR